MKSTVYVFSSGEFKRKQNTLFFTDGTTKKYIPVEGTNEIMLFGEVNFNKAILDFLAQNEIVLHLFNYYGYYFGSFFPRKHLNSGIVIVRQVEKYIDIKERLRLAALFVEGGLKNIKIILTYYNNRGKGLEKYIQQNQNSTEKLPEAKTIEQLMAIEGNARENYYKAFDTILDNADFMFEKRSRRPPLNSLNALISFCNSLVYVTTLKQIYHTQLDPRIGYLHTPNLRSFSLHLDIAEIFKPVIADRLIFSMINKGIIQKKDFEKKLQGILLNETGRKKVISEYDAKLKATIKHKKLKRNVSYERLIRLECHKLLKDILGEEDYEPFTARW